jgi:hypothetical protein
MTKYICIGALFTVQMSEKVTVTARPCGRVRRELMSKYEMVKAAGYTDTEIINEGIRTLSRRAKTRSKPQE